MGKEGREREGGQGEERKEGRKEWRERGKDKGRVLGGRATRGLSQSRGCPDSPQETSAGASQCRDTAEQVPVQHFPGQAVRVLESSVPDCEVPCDSNGPGESPFPQSVQGSPSYIDSGHALGFAPVSRPPAHGL